MEVTTNLYSEKNYKIIEVKQCFIKRAKIMFLHMENQIMQEQESMQVGVLFSSLIVMRMNW